MMKTTAKILSVTLLSLFASCSHKPDTILETVKAERGELTETVTATGTIESLSLIHI